MVFSRVIISLLAVLAFIVPKSSSPLGALAPRPEPGASQIGYAPGIVVVGWREDIRSSRADDLLAQGSAERSLGRARTARSIRGVGVDVLRVDVGSEEAWLAYLRSDSRVAFAELDHPVSVVGSPSGTWAGNGSEMAPQSITPNDPSYTMQWGLATMRLPEAWQRTTGAPGVIIAIVDTGLAVNHPDLAGKLWRNSDEIDGNGVDDDGNGHIDDVHGWHFFHTLSGSAYVPADDANIVDEHGHGSHVAGIAAASSNNGLGIAGVSWGAQIMVVRVLGADGTGWYSDVAAAVLYAADNGARVINLSLGDDEPSALLCEAIRYARDRGCLVVAAAGNSGTAVLCPATCPHALAVAASDNADRRASYSNYGPQIDLTAPGTSIYSTWPWAGGYLYLSGTSMAAAHVSGLASLVWSLWPDLGPDEVAQQMMYATKDIDPPGVDIYTGHGRVDAARATARLYRAYNYFLPLLQNQRP